MSALINISGYKFVTLNDTVALRPKIKGQCVQLGLKGTILLAPEGINVTISGTKDALQNFEEFLKEDPRFSDMTFKESPSDHQPFNRMLVRLKKEIIAFGVEGIEPGVYTSPFVKPTVLKEWLDKGEDVVMLDTRNEYEMKLGTFKDAINPHIDSFREFPAAVRALDPSLKNKKIVTFCTGGVRCEKAAPFMEKEGFKEVYQIEGGILKYFEECGGAHWEGDCFVFDQRVAVNPNLEETTAKQCFACRSPLTLEECKTSAYQPNVSCPYCIGKRAADALPVHL
ncbi:MAG: sulfurtransferase [Alphaproteobacteria bacterium]